MSIKIRILLSYIRFYILGSFFLKLRILFWGSQSLLSWAPVLIHKTRTVRGVVELTVYVKGLKKVSLTDSWEGRSWCAGLGRRREVATTSTQSPGCNPRKLLSWGGLKAIWLTSGFGPGLNQWWPLKPLGLFWPPATCVWGRKAHG